MTETPDFARVAAMSNATHHARNFAHLSAPQPFQTAQRDVPQDEWRAPGRDILDHFRFGHCSF